MKKILLVALILVTLGAIIVVGAVVYEFTITGNVTIVETPGGDYEVKAYQDLACTIPLTNIDWGSMGCGEIKNFDFYLKNTGNQKINEVIIHTEIPGMYGAGGTQGGFSLDVGEIRQTLAYLSIPAEATPGSYTVTTEITCVA